MFIYSIRSMFWLLVTNVLLLLSWTCLPVGSRSPNSSFVYSFVPHSRSVCLSVLVHSCHMASPFPYKTVSHCCGSVRVGPLFISAFVTLSAIQQCSRFHHPLTRSEYVLYLLREWPCMGCRWLVNGYRHSKDRPAFMFRVKQLQKIVFVSKIFRNVGKSSSFNILL